MAYQQFRARSQRPVTIAISLRAFYICIGPSILRRAENASKMPLICRTYSASTVGKPPQLPTSPKSAKSQSLSAHTPGSSKPAKTIPSSAQTLISPKSHKKMKVTPELIVYHNPESAASVKMLKFLYSAQIAYPQSKKHTGPPLDFRLNILARLPTAKELQDMYSLLNESSWTIFRARNATSNYRHHPTSARSLLELIGHERQAEIAKAKQKTQHNSVVIMNAETDSSPTEPIATELPAEEFPILDINHPLFGTQTFLWPIMVYWGAKTVIVGPRLKYVQRMLKDFASERDDIVVKTEEQIKEEAEKAKQANWSYPEKEVSPDEDDILEWFNESRKKPVKKLFW